MFARDGEKDVSLVRVLAVITKDCGQTDRRDVADAMSCDTSWGATPRERERERESERERERRDDPMVQRDGSREWGSGPGKSSTLEPVSRTDADNDKED